MDDKIKRYYKYYENQFANIIGLPRLETIAKNKNLEWLEKAVQNFGYPWSSIWRYENLANMKYLVPLRKTDYICTVFKISRKWVKKQTITTYAVMYSHVDGRKIIHDYVAISPTYRSADGEYRHRFVPVQQLVDHRNKNVDIYDDVETMIAKQATKGEISFQTYSFLEDESKRQSLEDSINNNRFILSFYAAEWFLEYTRIYLNRSENHIAAGYHESMFGESDIKVWNKHENFLLNAEESGEFLHGLFKLVTKPGQSVNTTELGQKIIPLTVRDVELSDDLRLAPWREMYITSRAGDLVINGICPGIPLMNDWFFIRGMSKELFDNAVSHVKLDHSDAASEIIKKLEDSRKSTYVIDPIKKNEIYISYKMEGFSSAIEIPMDYAEKELVLAPYVLVKSEEHLGRTVADIPMMMMFDDYALAMGPIFKDINRFSKYIFEFLYNLSCLNHYGIIHGDLHLNNCTIYEMMLYINRITGKMVVNNPHIIYECNGSQYIFSTSGRNVALIDFSRAFIWDKGILSKDYNENQIKAIQTNYKGRMLNVMKFEFPDFTDAHKDDIELAIERHFDEVYKIFQISDTWKIMSGWEVLLQSILDNPKYVGKFGDREMILNQALPLVISIKDAAYDFFTSNMMEVMNNPKRISFDIPSPNKSFIPKYFSNFLVERFTPDPKNPITLADYYSDANELRYNTREYENFPPTIKFDYVKKHDIHDDDLRIKGYDAHNLYLANHNPKEEVQSIAQSMTESRSERRGTPAEKIKKESAELADKLKLQIASSDDIYFST
jgi:hypothetical protein